MTWTREERALSFGSIAEHYWRYRPAPPAEAVDWVIQGARPDSEGRTGVSRAVDLAAGTGALTSTLAKRVSDVVAVEPDPGMREVFVRLLPGVPLVGALAEALPFVSGRIDALTVSSAWHWMDPQRAPFEISRVLRRGGVLGTIWNGVDRKVEWVDELFEDGRERSFVEPQSSHRHRFDLPEQAGLVDVEVNVVHWTKNLDLEQMVGLAGSYSRVFNLPEDRRDAVLGRVARLGRERLEEAGAVELSVPMRCACWRAVKS